MQTIRYPLLLQKYTPDLNQNCTIDIPKVVMCNKAVAVEEI